MRELEQDIMNVWTPFRLPENIWGKEGNCIQKVIY
jgi:hypothetical protein